MLQPIPLLKAAQHFSNVWTLDCSFFTVNGVLLKRNAARFSHSRYSGIQTWPEPSVRVSKKPCSNILQNISNLSCCQLLLQRLPTKGVKYESYISTFNSWPHRDHHNKSFCIQGSSCQLITMQKGHIFFKKKQKKQICITYISLIIKQFSNFTDNQKFTSKRDLGIMSTKER